ncbi:TPA: aspartate aminotransferase [Candidatus Acetothermia bacterium]|nr:aspartate aminotransferase [Candidatus Acetothermia bacterium]
MKRAKRIQGLSRSGTARVMERAAELRRAGIDLIDLTAGDPDFPTPEHIKDAAQRAIAENFTHYTAAAGIPELREAVAANYRREYGTDVEADEVLITCGAKQALFSLALALLEEGDEVILPAPFWPTYPALAELTGAQVRVLATHAEERFRVHPPQVERLLSPRTKVIVLNFPCNPTGALIDPDHLETIIHTALARDIYVISDESYEKIVFDRRPISAALFREENVIVVGSFSKNYAMTGWRVGYVIGNRRLIRDLVAIQSHLVTHPCSISQQAAVAAITGEQREVNRMVDEYRRRRDLLVEGLNRIVGVRCHLPEGAFYAFADFSPFLAGDSVSLAERLLDAGVAVVPGAVFGSDGFLRISFCHRQEKVEQGITRIAQTLSSWESDCDR